jgi:hypothetical protein
MVTKCQALLLKTYGLQVSEVVEQAGNHDPDDISESIKSKIFDLKYPSKLNKLKHVRKNTYMMEMSIHCMSTRRSSSSS